MTRPKILVVEDEKVVATDIEECLRRLGYSVVGAAASGVNAIRKAVETEPDLVLMDIKLKGTMDGIDAAGELHQRLGIPVVYLTAHADGETLQRAKRTSPSGYVLKPFDERALRSAVEIALHQHPRERELIESEQRLVRALRSIDEAVILTQRTGLITLMNRAAETLTGWSQADALGKRIKDVLTTINGATAAIMRNPVGRVLREGVSIGLGDRTVAVSRHGSETWIRGSATPLRNDDREVVGAAVVFHAASESDGEETRSGEQLQHANRLETAGRLAGGIAGNFSSILALIGDCGQQLLDRLGSSNAASSELEKILKAAEQGKQLADRLAAFTQRRIARPRTVDLNEAVEGLGDLLQCAAGEGIEILTALSAKAGAVNADPAHIEQVILNLVAVCRDSMPAGGKLTIETGNIELLGEYARAHTSLDPGPYVMLAVSHTGPVVPPKTENLKQEMPAVCEMVTVAGGGIRVQSEPGRVTTYEIYLPRVEKDRKVTSVS